MAFSDVWNWSMVILSPRPTSALVAAGNPMEPLHIICTTYFYVLGENLEKHLQLEIFNIRRYHILPTKMTHTPSRNPGV